ncbi:MAG: response regulator, partial [Anaerolineales bacterium]|nr:response regulator [Anaerolineales bacterium]
MWTALKKWLKPPTFEDDDQNRIARILNFIILAYGGLCCLVVPLLMITYVRTGNSYQRVLVFILVGMTIFYLGGLRPLLSRGYIKLAAYCLIVITYGCMVFTNYLVGTVATPISGGYLLVLVLTALLLPRQNIIGMTILIIITVAVFVQAEQAGLITAVNTGANASTVVTMFSLSVITAFLLGVTNQAIEQSLQKVREQAQALVQSNRELQTLQLSLEDQVHERTQTAVQARREAEIAQEAIAEQVWQASGDAKLAELLRNEQDFQQLARVVIDFLCQYLDVQMGAFYLFENNALHLLSSYAFTKRKHLQNRFLLGDGLIGQAALERSTIELTEVPLDYLPWVTGLGTAVPASILVSPFAHENQLMGVVELASLNRFTDKQRRFLVSALESVAITVHTMQNRLKIDALLQETQQQAAELQAQEEELRATNEELEIQAENLRLSQERLQLQQRSLKQANVELEESTSILRAQQAKLDQQNQALRLTHKNLEQKAEELALASKYKSEFLANMSHELRTPLNSLLILAQMLERNDEGNLTADQIESAQIIYNSGHDLLNLINEILDLSKIEAGRMELYFAPMAFDDVIQGMRQQFNHVASQNEVAFITTLDASLPPSIETDQLRVEQILKNLLSNAFKFTEKGSVTLEIAPAQASQFLDNIGLSSETAVALCVTDTGIGMTEAQQAIVFEGFQQADGSTSRKYGGTGLGLTISRELAIRLGGGIHLESTLGEGSVFTLYLPLRQVSSAAVEAAVRPPKLIPAVLSDAQAPTPRPFVDDRDHLDAGRRCLLIIEDDLNFVRILCDYAHKKGFQCLVATNGQTGLTLAVTHKPDAIILDLRLPNQSGWDVLEALKQNSDTRHIPVHIVSVDDATMDAYQMGAIGFLSKPVDAQGLDEIFHRIETFIDRAVKNLLIVEDDLTSRHTIQKLLSGDDIQIAEAANGQKALELIKTQTFDCIILDLSLPDMSGFELLNQIQEQDSFPDCPIIVYTGKSLTEEENIELMKYADSIIIKGIKSPERLLDETALFLHRVVADLLEEKQRT